MVEASSISSFGPLFLDITSVFVAAVVEEGKERRDVEALGKLGKLREVVAEFINGCGV